MVNPWLRRGPDVQRPERPLNSPAVRLGASDDEFPAVPLLFPALTTGAFAAAPDRDIPQFAPNPAVGWVAFAPAWIAPATGPGPVADDPSHPRIGNDEFRAQGAQPTFPLPD